MTKALIVVTNTAQFGSLKRPTGVWLSEATHFHQVMADNGINVDYLSPRGGYVPLDPGSIAADAIDETSWHFYGDPEFRQRNLANSLRPDQVNPDDYDIVYYAGGHGTMWTSQTAPRWQKSPARFTPTAVSSVLYATGLWAYSRCSKTVSISSAAKN